MDKIKIKIKKLHVDAKTPTQANDTDAGYDVYAVDNGKNEISDSGYSGYCSGYVEYGTGIAIEPEAGYHIEIVPRSSITTKDLMLKNSIGIIDNGYRGELKFRFFNTKENFPGNIYKKGDKIGQILIRKTIHAIFEEVDELSDTSRGVGGYGSSDTKKG